jgi:sugar O-acyltransferase (sialic acid O-acetyltransferase NeuD family)
VKESTKKDKQPQKLSVIKYNLISMYLFGASGHGKVIAEIAELNGIEIKAFIDEDITKKQLIDYLIQQKIPESQLEILISVGDNYTRKKIVEKHKNFIYKTLIHPKSNISKRVEIGHGTVVMAGVSINSGTEIGHHCILNTNASIDHDCHLSDFTHISPNAALAGGVFVGEGTHIGIGASVIQGVQIGKWCIIGAGAVVIRDVPDGATVVGNPARRIR